MNLPPLTPPTSSSGSDQNPATDPSLQSPTLAGSQPPVPPPTSVPSEAVVEEPVQSQNLEMDLGSAPPVEPLGTEMPLPQVAEPSIAPFQSTAAVQETPAPAAFQPEAPTAQVAPAVQEPEFVPTSPLLENLQEISSQPFQDPGSQNASNGVPAESASSQSTVPQESLGMAAGGAAANASMAGAEASSPPPPAAGSPPNKPGFSLPSFPSGKPLFALLAGIVLLVVGIGAALFFLNPPGSSPKPGTQAPSAKSTITYWGLWEPSEVMEPLIQQYEDLNPGIDIVYTQQNRQQYRARMQTAIRGSNGPDIFRYHNTWIPMLKDDLATAPRAVFSASELQQEYYPVMAEELVRSNSAVGVPLMFEGLALLYNESMLEAANALPPKDWREVRELAVRLSIQGANASTLSRGGIALGTAENVDSASDILALMMLQNAATPGNPMSPNAQTALEFYTLFSRTDGVWNATMPQSTVAFANEQVAMILVPSWRIHEIQKLNPNLRFGVARLPQLSDERITWASYWAEGVSKNSKNAEESWKFLAWLSQPDQLRRLYSEAVKYRGFGELYPRVKMASELEDPLVQPYLEDALFAKSWPLASMTHDEGLNDQLIQYYTDAINQMNRTGNAEAALEGVFPGIQQVLSRYGYSVTAPAAR